MMTYDENCPSCDTEFEVTQGVDGCCPKCGRKYTWDWDCGDEFSAVYIPDWEPEELKKDES